MERYLIPNILPTLVNLQRDDQLNWAGDRGPFRRSKNDSSDPANPFLLEGILYAPSSTYGVGAYPPEEGRHHLVWGSMNLSAAVERYLIPNNT
jgi:hypothetical protein